MGVMQLQAKEFMHCQEAWGAGKGEGDSSPGSFQEAQLCQDFD